MKTVPLHGAKAAGRVALVDDDDYELVMQYRWRVIENRSGVAYACSSPGRTTLAMHKLITGWARTDHEDGNGLNNQRYNLRPATLQENARNSRSYRGSSSH